MRAVIVWCLDESCFGCFRDLRLLAQHQKVLVGGFESVCLWLPMLVTLPARSRNFVRLWVPPVASARSMGCRLQITSGSQSHSCLSLVGVATELCLFQDHKYLVSNNERSNHAEYLLAEETGTSARAYCCRMYTLFPRHEVLVIRIYCCLHIIPGTPKRANDNY